MQFMRKLNDRSYKNENGEVFLLKITSLVMINRVFLSLGDDFFKKTKKKLALLMLDCYNLYHGN